MVPAAFQHVEEAGHVAVDIGVRVPQRVAHAGLGGEVHDAIERLRSSNSLLMPSRSAKSSWRNAKPGCGLKPRQPRLLQRRIVVVVEVVDADDLVAAREQSLADVHADEAGATGDQDFHGVV